MNTISFIIRTYLMINIPDLTLSNLTLHCHLYPLQATNCCRNSRLVVDEDDFDVGDKLKKIFMYR